MTRAADTELIDSFKEFYRSYYHDEIEELARKYPKNQRSLYIDWDDLYQFDSDLAYDFRTKPDQLREYAEEALRLYDLSVDASLGAAHVRVQGIPEHTNVSEIRADTRGALIATRGIVRKTTDINPKITNAAFECQRCGTLTRIPQSDDDLEEPHECQGCERQGPFAVNFDQSEFVDAQKIRLIDDSATLSDGEVPKEISINIEDDITGKVAAGDLVEVTGVVKLDQKHSSGDGSREYDVYLNALSVESQKRENFTEKTTQENSIPDLNTYTNVAATALSTLPEDAREEETKAKLITPFIEALGWNKYDSTEVRLEYSDSKTGMRPDYAFFGPDSETPDVVLEAKQLGTNLKTKEKQLYDYMRVFSAEWGILSNGEDFYIYRRSGDDYLPEKLAEAEIEDLSEASLVDSFRRGAFYEDD